MSFHIKGVLAGLLVLSLCQGVSAQQEGRGALEPVPRIPAEEKEGPARRPRQLPPGGLVGKIEYYESKMDGERRPYVICATDDTKEPKPLLLIVNPGGTGLEGAMYTTAEFAYMGKKNNQPCVVLRPTGRGGGSVYQHYGEIDLLEAVEDACTKYPIDRDHISVLGHSMGGAAVFYLTSHYPDLFAAGAPLSGYCDYRLWAKPGGYTFHMHEWEEPSWRSRSAVFLPENFLHTPLWIAHGELDRAIGGGVPVEHSREMARLLNEKGYRYQYTEVAGAGHHFTPQAPDLAEKIAVWCLQQKKMRSPDHVSLVTYALRHNRSYWVTIEQLLRYPERGFVDARVADGRVEVKTEGIRTLSLGPVPGCGTATVVIDGQEIAALDLGSPKMFRRNDKGKWESGVFDLSGEKRHSSSGPIGDLFFDGLILVPGTAGTEREALFTSWIAGNARSLYKERNGGVHRGGIMGDNIVELPILKDSELTEDLLKHYNLLLYGTYATNSVLARFKGKLPLEFEGKTIRLAGKTYTGDQVTVFAVFPHPENPNRYVAVHGGVTPDAIVFGSHLDMALLPDYLVYDGGRALDWGFWGNDWKSQE